MIENINSLDFMRRELYLELRFLKKMKRNLNQDQKKSIIRNFLDIFQFDYYELDILLMKLFLLKLLGSQLDLEEINKEVYGVSVFKDSHLFLFVNHLDKGLKVLFTGDLS